MTDESFLGLVESGDDPRDWPLEGAIADNPAPTERAYRSATFWPNANQFYSTATKSSCVGYSGANSRVMTESLVDGLDLRFDQQELYRACKAIDGMPTQPGTSIRVALGILQNRGAAIGVVTEGNGGRAFALTPAQYKPISGYVRVDMTLLDEIKKAIYYLGHCWAAIRWYANWNPSQNPPAILPKPGTYTTGHGIVFYGWDDDLSTWAGKGGLRFKNSFGKGWGDGGDGVIPYQILATVLRETWATFDVPDTQPELPEPPVTGDPTESDMPAISNYQPGYTATIDTNSRIRETPTLAGKVIRVTQVPETWSIVGQVIGDTAEGSDQWVARFSGNRWEYTHASNLSEDPTPPLSQAALDAVEADRDAALVKIEAAKAALE